MEANELGWTDLPPDMDPKVYRMAAVGPIKGLRDNVIRIPYKAESGLIAWSELETGSVNELLVYQMLERVPDVSEFFRELYRVCASKAKVQIHGVYYNHMDVFADPSRRRGICERLFGYLSPLGREQFGRDPHDDGVAASLFEGVDFEATQIHHISEPEWEGRSDEARVWGLTHNMNVVRRITVSLVAHKPIRTKW